MKRGRREVGREGGRERGREKEEREREGERREREGRREKREGGGEIKKQLHCKFTILSCDKILLNCLMTKASISNQKVT